MPLLELETTSQHPLINLPFDAGQGSLPSDLPSLGAGAGGLPSGSLPTALPAPSGSTYGSGSGLTPLNGGGLSREATDPPNEKRQDLGSLGGSGGSLPTGIPSGFGSSTGGIGSFSSLIPSSGSGLGSLGGSCGDLGSLGGGRSYQTMEGFPKTSGLEMLLLVYEYLPPAPTCLNIG